MERKTLVKSCLFLLSALLPAQISFGAGSPILLIGSSGNQFSFYCAEILRAEGVNAFDIADISVVTAATLSAYDVVVLGQVTLTSGQVTMLTSWVNGGGNLIAMRPDKQLATLLGIGDTGTTLSNGYLLVNTSSAPGTGIVGQTIQFHGTADLYVPSGASTVATLYSSASAVTPYPAVTLRTGIGLGGNAAAFTYDLARSIVYTRQGNPAWAGQARVGQGAPIRAGDMFYGNAAFDPQLDWVDLNKVAIPQADEQQRLLANLILYLNRSKKPLPRFWYFPLGKKAVVIMTGDDHANGGTAGRFDDFIASSPAGCSVANWECIRGTSYIYPNSPLTNTQAANYIGQGFEVALHVTTNCADYNGAPALESFFATQFGTFASVYPSVPAPTTNRTHCIAWDDWATEAQVELNHGIRLDTTYYYWPASWIQNRPGMYTGSGMPMRFAQTDGTVINVYQAVTQMPDESGEVFPDFINALLDNAVGTAGFYGAFTANMHTDYNTGGTCTGVFCNSQLWADQIVSAAKSRGVPVVSSKQMLQWLDGRNGSTFGSISWSGNVLAFTITAAVGASGLQAMVPTVSPVGVLSGITQGGSPVSYSVQTIKGIAYAFISAASGNYQATYAGALPPVITAVTAIPGNTTATIAWTTDKLSNSKVDYGITTSLGTSAPDAAMVTAHSISLSGLVAGTTYNYRVTSVDGSGNGASSPTAPATASFTTIDPTPPVITAVVATPGTNGKSTITWTTNKLSNSRVDYGLSATSLSLNVSDATLISSHSIVLTGLTAGITYYYRVTSADALGNSSSSPAAPGTLSFVEIAAVSVWGSATTPATIDSGDAGAVILGMKFRSDVAGIVTGVRFYKAVANTGVHTGRLWSGSGTLLGSVTFAAETASGWQQANFAAPISIAANTTYVVAYFAPSGHYSANDGFFASLGVDSPPLHALATGVDGPNGVYLYGSTNGFPNQSFNTSNYWVDLVFTDNVPPVISAAAATTTPTTATITWTTNESSNSSVNYGTSPTALTLNASAAAMATAHSVTLTGLTPGTVYYYQVTSLDPFGNRSTSPTTPASFTATDTTPPVITAVTATSGTTTATITWTSDKNSNSRVDYGISPASLTLNVANGTLVTSHSISLIGLSTATAYFFRVSSVDASGNSATSPPSSGSPATFTTIDPAPPVITAVAATPGSNTAIIAWTTNKPSNSHVDYGISAASLTLNVSDATLVGSHSLTLTGLTQGTTYYYRVTSTDTLGNTTSSPVAPATANFVENSTRSVWSASAIPSNVDSGDPGAVELGMRFRSDSPGVIAGVRFYKASTSTGTHIGNLWSNTGTLLGTVTFTGETPSGWQQANFTTPVSINSNTTYVVSYYTPTGHYSFSALGLASGVNNVPLHALADGFDGANGVYRYGASSGFPNQTFQSENYWVDVAFVDNTPPTISAITASSAGTSAVITWSTNEAANSRVAYGTSSSTLNLNATDAVMVTSHSITLGGLAPSTTYFYQVTSVDPSGNASTSPASPVTFTTTTPQPPVISALTATPNLGGTALISWATNTPSTSVVAYGTSPGTLTLNAGNTALVTGHSITLTGLTQAQTYYYTVTSVDSGGLSSTSPASAASFVENAISIWSVSTVPAVVDSGDPGAVELGVKLRSTVAGTVLGIQFYKNANNTGAHVGHLWSSTGALLASVTFANETASGWQQAYFSTPIAISANTTYILSYYAPAGHYSANSSYFVSSGATNGSLQALANGVDGPNGVYVYGASAFPALTFASTNYWVDVIFH